MRGALTVLLFVTAGVVAAEVSQGFDHFYNLEYDQALACFEREVAADPADPSLHNHIAQTVLFREMFRVGALESEMVSRNNPFLRRPNMNPSPGSAKLFDDNIAAAIKLGQERLTRNPKDWQALYALGVSYGLRANWEWLVHKVWREALRDATTARRLHTAGSGVESEVHRCLPRARRPQLPGRQPALELQDLRFSGRYSRRPRGRFEAAEPGRGPG